MRKPTIWGHFMIWEGQWVKVYTSWMGAWLKWSATENRHNVDAPPDEPHVYIRWMDGHSPILGPVTEHEETPWP